MSSLAIVPGRELVVHSPEHVAIALVPAGLGSRFAAFAFDTLLAIAASTLAGMVLSALLPTALANPAALTAGFIITWGYHVWFEVRHAGRTPGKQLAHLRVVDDRGLPLTLRQSAVRNVVRVLDMMPLGGIGALSCVIGRHGRRLGDLAARTLVVAERQSPLIDRAVLAARRHNSLVDSHLRRLVEHRLSLDERELLLALCLRSDRLADSARYRLFEDVAARYRIDLGIDDPLLSGENLVRALVAICFGWRDD